MDFQNTGDFTQQPSPSPMPPMVSPPPKQGAGWKIFWGIITAFSVMANVLFFFIVVGMAVLLAGGQDRKFVEEVIETGPRTNRIAVVSINGLIDERQAKDVHWQLKEARADKTVKAVIIRINSPGGTLSGSDQIHNEITRFQAETGKPAISFMQGVAASGGYYSAVACDKIIAEPTAITGSIGVIMGYLVLQDLLEQKLGILPVVVKAGSKKDWPSSFQKPTEEQLQYLQGRIIDPAYKRFLEVVVDGRKELTEDDVRRLADGSIYWADEALKEKLIDKIGYLKDAIKEIKEKAGIDKAQVVEYRKPFSLSDILSAQADARMKIDQKTLYELSTPQILYLWTGPK